MRCKFVAKPGQIERCVDLPYQMIFGNRVTKTKLVEQLTLVTLQMAHHGSISPRFASAESRCAAGLNRLLQQNLPIADIRDECTKVRGHIAISRGVGAKYNGLATTDRRFPAAISPGLVSISLCLSVIVDRETEFGMAQCCLPAMSEEEFS